ncbi:MAG: tetratricopeptide repeat protein [Saprospiraceae bacterium]|nr:tetratricopeptide repeat protein [Saprospiraceae bacterium]
MKKPILLLCLLLGLALASKAQSPADSLAALLPGMDERRQADFINEHFYTFYSNNYDQAVALGEQALSIAERQNMPSVKALTLKNIGVVHYLKGDYEKALTHYQRSLDLYESLKDLVGEGNVLREMANYFKKTGQHDKALVNLEKAIQLCTEARDTACITASLDIRGVVFLELGKLDEAEANFTKELALLERTGDQNGLSYTFDNLAAVATERGRFEQAIQLLEQSQTIRQRLGDEHGVAININNMGEALLRAGQPAKALPYFQEALRKSEAIGFSDLRRHVMQMLSDTYSGMGSDALAMDWLQKSYALKDSMFNEERSRQLAEMATKYETEKKEKELARQEAILQRRNAYLLLAVVLLSAAFAIFGFVLRQQKQKRREAELQAELTTSEAANRLQEERLRISRDLHDNLGAELTIIGSTLSRKAFQAGSEMEKQELEVIGGNARQAMGLLRETIWAIRHEQFSVKQLAEKIGDFAVRATSLPVEVQASESGIMLSPSQTLNLYRIAQEAITNAVKYAGATAIKVVFENAAGNHLKLTVSDDGMGFDTANKFSGNGLVNMQSRAAEMGGRLELSSSEAGTKVVVEFMGVESKNHS